jgi:putative (di)nucleoside polyphosphate hydrolase
MVAHRVRPRRDFARPQRWRALPESGAAWRMPALPLWSGPVIDPDGYRPNVGIVLIRDDARVFWARRVARDGWQFPQGGMRTDETPLEAMYRELREETGLKPHHVEVLGATPGWLRYRLPRRYLRRHEKPMCIGQKQVWFLLRLLGEESDLRLDACEKPEFDLWRWVDFWYPISHVVSFKRGVYERALRALAPLTEPMGEVAGRVLEAAPPLTGQGQTEEREMRRRHPRRRERKSVSY